VDALHLRQAVLDVAEKGCGEELAAKQKLANTSVARHDEGERRQLVDVLDVLLGAILLSHEVVEGAGARHVNARIARLEALQSW